MSQKQAKFKYATTINAEITSDKTTISLMNERGDEVKTLEIPTDTFHALFGVVDLVSVHNPMES